MFFAFIAVLCAFCLLLFLGNSLFLLLKTRPENPFLAFWAGTAIACFLSLFFACLMPLGQPLCLVILIMLALPGIACTWHKIRKPDIKFAVILILTAAILIHAILYSISGSVQYDSGLYHLQFVRWLREYGIVYGLGNLHFRFAPPSAWLSLAAIFEQGALTAQSAFIMQNLWILGAFCYFAWQALYSHKTAMRIFALSLICWLGICTFSANASAHLAYDRPALLFFAVAISRLLDCIAFKPNLQKNGICSYITVSSENACIILMLLAASYIIKPLAVPGIIIICALITCCCFKNRFSCRQMLKIFLYPFAAACVWIYCNTVLTGWPVFPVTLLPINADWTMPAKQVEEMRLAVQGWARLPNNCNEAMIKGISFWFAPWLKLQLKTRFFLSGALLPLLLGLICWIKAFLQPQLRNIKLFFCLIFVLQFAYWFFQHPDIRFGLEFFWCWLGAGMAFSFSCSRSALFFNKYSSFICIFILICTVINAFGADKANKYCQKALQSKQILMPLPLMPSANIISAKIHKNTEDCFTLYFPQDDDRCGNAPLPCAPAYTGKLMLRNAKNLGQGFKQLPE